MWRSGQNFHKRLLWKWGALKIAWAPNWFFLRFFPDTHRNTYYKKKSRQNIFCALYDWVPRLAQSKSAKKPRHQRFASPSRLHLSAPSCSTAEGSVGATPCPSGRRSCINPRIIGGSASGRTLRSIRARDSSRSSPEHTVMTRNGLCIEVWCAKEHFQIYCGGWEKYQEHLSRDFQNPSHNLVRRETQKNWTYNLLITIRNLRNKWGVQDLLLKMGKSSRLVFWGKKHGIFAHVAHERHFCAHQSTSLGGRCPPPSPPSPRPLGQRPA